MAGSGGAESEKPGASKVAGEAAGKVGQACKPEKTAKAEKAEKAKKAKKSEDGDRGAKAGEADAASNAQAGSKVEEGDQPDKTDSPTALRRIDVPELTSMPEFFSKGWICEEFAYKSGQSQGQRYRRFTSPGGKKQILSLSQAVKQDAKERDADVTEAAKRWELHLQEKEQKREQERRRPGEEFRARFGALTPAIASHLKGWRRRSTGWTGPDGKDYASLEEVEVALGKRLAEEEEATRKEVEDAVRTVKAGERMFGVRAQQAAPARPEQPPAQSSAASSAASSRPPASEGSPGRRLFKTGSPRSRASSAAGEGAEKAAEQQADAARSAAPAPPKRRCMRKTSDRQLAATAEAEERPDAEAAQDAPPPATEDTEAAAMFMVGWLKAMPSSAAPPAADAAGEEKGGSAATEAGTKRKVGRPPKKQAPPPQPSPDCEQSLVVDITDTPVAKEKLAPGGAKKRKAPAAAAKAPAKAKEDDLEEAVIVDDGSGTPPRQQPVAGERPQGRDQSSAKQPKPPARASGKASGSTALQKLKQKPDASSEDVPTLWHRGCAPRKEKDLRPKPLWQRLRKWLAEWGSCKKQGGHRGALLTGVSGCGKSVGARLMATNIRGQVLEYDLGEVAGRSFLDALAKRQTTCEGSVAILRIPDDPIDSLRDRICAAANRSPMPVILLGGDEALRMDGITTTCLHLPVQLGGQVMARTLQRVVVEEQGLHGAEAGCAAIAKAAAGDLRRAVNAAQLLSASPACLADGALPPWAAVSQMGVCEHFAHGAGESPVEERLQLLSLDEGGELPAALHDAYLHSPERQPDPRELETLAGAAADLARHDVVTAAAASTAWASGPVTGAAADALLLPACGAAQFPRERVEQGDSCPVNVGQCNRYADELQLPRSWVTEQVVVWMQTCNHLKAGLFRFWVKQRAQRQFGLTAQGRKQEVRGSGEEEQTERASEEVEADGMEAEEAEEAEEEEAAHEDPEDEDVEPEEAEEPPASEKPRDSEAKEGGVGDEQRSPSYGSKAAKRKRDLELVTDPHNEKVEELKTLIKIASDEEKFKRMAHFQAQLREMESNAKIDKLKKAINLSASEEKYDEMAALVAEMKEAKEQQRQRQEETEQCRVQRLLEESSHKTQGAEETERPRKCKKAGAKAAPTTTKDGSAVDLTD